MGLFPRFLASLLWYSLWALKVVLETPCQMSREVGKSVSLWLSYPSCGRYCSAESWYKVTPSTSDQLALSREVSVPVAS